MARTKFARPREVTALMARVRGLVGQRGWSAYRLAQEAGISESLAGRILYRECKDPSFTTIMRVADALGVSLDHLAGRHGQGP